MGQIFDWVMEEVMGLEGSRPMRVNMLCNRMHRVDVFGRIQADETLRKEWHPEQLSMVLARDGESQISEVLWPEVFPVEWCRSKERKVGYKAWRVEYENKPFESDELTFSYESLQKYRFKRAEVNPTWPGKIALDVAAGRSKTSDNTVILKGKLSPDKVRWVERGFRGRVTQAAAIAIVIDWCAEDPAVREVHVETIGVGEGLCQRLEEEFRYRAIRVKVVRVDNSRRTKRGIPTNKIDRVETIQIAVNDGDIRFCEDLGPLIEEVAQFPTGEHDDVPDCAQILDDAFRADASQGPRYAGGVGLTGVDVLKIN